MASLLVLHSELPSTYIIITLFTTVLIASLRFGVIFTTLTSSILLALLLFRSPQALAMDLPSGFPSEYRVPTQEGKETALKVSLRVPVPVSCGGPVFARVIGI